MPGSDMCAKVRAIMFVRPIRRKKDGKTPVYWKIAENRRLDNGGVVQRQVLYLGEMGLSQAAAWRRALEGFDEASGQITRYKNRTNHQSVTITSLLHGIPKIVTVRAYLC